MDHEANTVHNALERMLLDENAEPIHMPFSLLQYITNGFSDDQQIGSGGFAVVYKGMVGHGMVAVKKLTKTFNMEEKKFHEEVKCLVKAKHKNIVRFLGYCAETQGKIADYEGKFVMADTRNWMLCFEYVPNGSLDKYITDASYGLQWSTRYGIIKGICEGLRYLHDKRILHLDLKPDNILIDNHMVPKIADFGLSRCLDEKQTRVFTAHLCGSMGYLAPEFFRGQFTFASDIYSLGVIIVEILTGEKGYPKDENVVESWMNRLKGDTQLEQVIVCTKIGIECMELEPAKRPAAWHIVDRLEKTGSIIDIGISSSSIEQQVSLTNKRHCQERTEHTFSPETEDVTKCKEAEDQWSIWGAQHTKEDRKDASIPSSNSSMFRKIENLDIFNSKSCSNNVMRNGVTLMQQSDSVAIFQKDELQPVLHMENITGEGGSPPLASLPEFSHLVWGHRFTLRDLEHSTNRFSNENLIGEGGYGVVYRGRLINGTDVAIKRLLNNMGQTEKEFRVEAEAIGHVRHKNLVHLLGYCVEGIHRMLVYEHVNNGNFEQWIHGTMRQQGILTWEVRMKIILGIAKALAYLHEGIEPKLVHRDIKPTNILIDEDFNGKLSDFGLAKLLDAREGHSTKIFMGTFGYVAPEYACRGLLNEKSDVYSFGVLLLEAVTGRDPVDYDRPSNEAVMLDWLKMMVDMRRDEEVVDPDMEVKPTIWALKRTLLVALWCVDPDSEKRPSIGHVIRMLEAEDVPSREDRRSQRGHVGNTDTESKASSSEFEISGDSGPST